MLILLIKHLPAILLISVKISSLYNQGYIIEDIYAQSILTNEKVLIPVTNISPMDDQMIRAN